MKTVQKKYHYLTLALIMSALATPVVASEHLSEYTEAAFQQKIQEGPVVLEFHLKGCPTCQAMAETVETIKADHKFSHVSVFQIDIHSKLGKTLMKKYNVRTPSVLAIFRKGCEENPLLTQSGNTEISYIQSQIEKVL